MFFAHYAIPLRIPRNHDCTAMTNYAARSKLDIAGIPYYPGDPMRSCWRQMRQALLTTAQPLRLTYLRAQGDPGLAEFFWYRVTYNTQGEQK